MSTQRKAEFSDTTMSEDAVHDYLVEHPDFFERHANLLGKLSLPHNAGGAVSLVERQVSVLRQKELKHERRMRDLLSVARANDELGRKIHRLTLKLLAAGDLGTTLECIEASLRTDFDADHSVLVMFAAADDFADLKAGRFLRTADRDDDGLKAFQTFLDGDSPRCGQIRDAQRDYLFGRETDELGSAALVPLGKGADLGMLAIGSVDAERFHPGMSLDFLERLGQLVHSALIRF